jgi:hypothetical protein
MKTTPIITVGIMVLAAGILPLGAAIIVGPITNPANGHDYYLLTPNTWSASEAEAENLGGTLAIIRDKNEQDWVFSQFGAHDGTNLNLWIGLHRVGYERTLVWVTGERLDYAHWAGGQPDDMGRVESCVFMASANRPWGFSTGTWADYTDSGVVEGSAPYAVVEVPGKSHETSLTGKEKSLIGVWYETGSPSQPCYISGTENMLFAINHGRAGRLLWTTDDDVFLSGWNAHGEIIEDRILWSDGTWWSREPTKYKKIGYQDGTSPESPDGDFPLIKR